MVKKQITINEAQLRGMILQAASEYLVEGRKVLKLGGNSQGSMGMPPQSPMPPMNNSMDMGIGGDSNGGGMPPMDNSMDMGMGGDPNMGGNMGDDGATTGDSDFDTNFDAGVEADEDTDPKKFIQQLTGKLSQSLSKYNNDNGMDVGLCKYVANMVIKQAAKGLDEKDRKDIIKAINTTAQDNSDEMPDEDGMGEEPDMNGDDMGGDEMPPMDNSNQQQNLQERKFTKRQLRRLYENIGCDDERQEMQHKISKIKIKSGPFKPKIFR